MEFHKQWIFSEKEKNNLIWYESERTQLFFCFFLLLSSRPSQAHFNELLLIEMDFPRKWNNHEDRQEYIRKLNYFIKKLLVCYVRASWNLILYCKQLDIYCLRLHLRIMKNTSGTFSSVGEHNKFVFKKKKRNKIITKTEKALSSFVTVANYYLYCYTSIALD